MNTHAKHLGIRSLVLVVVIAAILFAGIRISGAAAQAAIPGDALYPVKTSIEQTRLSLAQDAGNRAQLRMGFAEQRLEEIAALIEEGRYTEVNAAVLAFEADIHGAILELETISQVDPARGTRIALEITKALTLYAQTLSAMAANAPQSVAPVVSRALDTTQIASGLEMPPNVFGSDDNGNDNANTNGDDDNANTNGDDDSANNNGSDDNSNGNGNDDYTNANGSGDDTANSDDRDYDDNRNANVANGNGNDDNTNSSGIDDNVNSNSDDDSAISNGNGGDDNPNASNGNGDDNPNANSNDDNGNDNGDDSGGGGRDDNGNSSGGDDHGGNGNDRGNGDD